LWARRPGQVAAMPGANAGSNFQRSHLWRTGAAAAARRSTDRSAHARPAGARNPAEPRRARGECVRTSTQGWLDRVEAVAYRWAWARSALGCLAWPRQPDVVIQA